MGRDQQRPLDTAWRPRWYQQMGWQHVVNGALAVFVLGAVGVAVIVWAVVLASVLHQ